MRCFKAFLDLAFWGAWARGICHIERCHSSIDAPRSEYVRKYFFTEAVKECGRLWRKENSPQDPHLKPSSA